MQTSTAQHTGVMGALLSCHHIHIACIQACPQSLLAVLTVTSALVTGSSRWIGSASEQNFATCGARPSLQALAARADALARLIKVFVILNC